MTYQNSFYAANIASNKMSNSIKDIHKNKDIEIAWKFKEKRALCENFVEKGKIQIEWIWVPHPS